MDKWQFYEKAPRPALRWACIPIWLWIAGICDIAGFPMDGVTRGVILGGILAIYGIRAVENIKRAV